jgi:DNA-binding response OmpR family regulator
VGNPRNILIVEDEPLISMMLEDFLLSMGHRVSAICETVAEALEAVATTEFDIAILDVNLKGESVWPVAMRLREQSIPFVLASGGHVDPPPPQFENVPMIDKPYTIDRVSPALDAAMAV